MAASMSMLDSRTRATPQEIQEDDPYLKFQQSLGRRLQLDQTPDRYASSLERPTTEMPLKESHVNRAERQDLDFDIGSPADTQLIEARSSRRSRAPASSPAPWKCKFGILDQTRKLESISW